MDEKKIELDLKYFHTDYENIIQQINNIKLNNFTMIDFEENEEKLIITYNIIKSEGKKVRILGDIILDIETGYIIMSDRKEDEYIPIIDFYDFMFGVRNIRKGVFKILVEEFKLGSLPFRDFIELMLKKVRRSSTISQLVGDLGTDDSIKKKIDDFKDMFLYFKLLQNLYKILTFRISYFKEVDSIVFFKNLYNFWRIILPYYDDIDYIDDIDEYNLKLFEYEGTLNGEEKKKFKFRNFIKNLYDILENKDMDYVLDYLLLLDDYRDINDVINILDVNDYISSRFIYEYRNEVEGRLLDITFKLLSDDNLSILRSNDVFGLIRDVEIINKELGRGVKRINDIIKDS